ncbi:MAG: LON peptidase substrate-binding domain-containing protein [Candidatus Promineifilaceae bacterium]
MFEIPLFPLHTVLFPGMPLTLHIFEERYKQMIQLCLRQQSPFGVVLIRRGPEVGGEAEPHAVGCTARVTHVQPLEDGRMNLLAVGQERMRIVELKHDRAYPVGVVELWPLAATDGAGVAAANEQLRPLVSRYLTILANAEQIDRNAVRLPDDPQVFAFLAASLLQVPPEKKQTLLHQQDMPQLFAALQAFYRQEVAVLKALLRPLENGEQAGPFSLN